MASSYRILQIGKAFQAQRKVFGFWWDYGDPVWCSLESARKWIEEEVSEPKVVWANDRS